jgi:hypothetical protein
LATHFEYERVNTVEIDNEREARVYEKDIKRKECLADLPDVDLGMVARENVKILENAKRKMMRRDWLMIDPRDLCSQLERDFAGAIRL